MLKQDNNNRLKLFEFIKDHMASDHAMLLAMIFDNLVLLNMTIDDMTQLVKTSESDHVQNKSLTGALFCALQIRMLTETFLSNKELLSKINHPMVKQCVEMAEHNHKTALAFLDEMKALVDKNQGVAQ